MEDKMSLFHMGALCIMVCLPFALPAPCATGPSTCQCEETQGSYNIWCTGLTSIPANLPSQVQYLMIGDSNIETIPANSFTSYKNLDRLRIEKSQVKTIGNGAFNDLAQLRTLSLSDNPITNLHSGEGNIGTLGSLHTFELNNCGQEDLTTNMFKSMPNAQVIKLKNNKISKVPANIFGFYIQELYLDGNPIEKIGDSFSSLTNLEMLSLENCYIKEVEKTAFKDNKIETLNLRSNALDMSGIPEEAFRPIQNFLRTLDLSNNPLKSLDPKVFKGLGNMRTLNLSKTQLTDVPSSVFTELAKLTMLDISNNNLKYMTKETLTVVTAKTATINFCGNPWQCDCKIADLRNWLKLPNARVTDPNTCARCQSPENLIGKLIKDVVDKEITECITDYLGLSTAQITGIAVGLAALVLLVIIAVVIWCCCCRKKPRKEDKSQVIHYKSEKEVKEGVDGPQAEFQVTISQPSSPSVDDSDGKKNLDVSDVVIQPTDDEDSDVKRTPETRLKSATKYSAQPMPEEEQVNLPRESSF